MTHADTHPLLAVPFSSPVGTKTLNRQEWLKIFRHHRHSVEVHDHDSVRSRLLETHLYRVLSCYFRYYRRSRTHLSLSKDCLDPRGVQPPSAGKIVPFPEVVDCIIVTNAARPEPRRRSIGRSPQRDPALSTHGAGSAHI
jgi:hypothetical protein